MDFKEGSILTSSISSLSSTVTSSEMLLYTVILAGGFKTWTINE